MSDASDIEVQDMLSIPVNPQGTIQDILSSNTLNTLFTLASGDSGTERAEVKYNKGIFSYPFSATNMPSLPKPDSH